jgi:hypothetical protein
MLPDPQLVTVNSVAQSMAKVSSTGTSSTYEKADSKYKLTISHQTVSKGRIRTLVRFEHKEIVSNPLDSSNDYDFQALQLVFDRPQFGFTSTQLSDDWAGLKAWLDATMLAKLYGRES